MLWTPLRQSEFFLSFVRFHSVNHLNHLFKDKQSVEFYARQTSTLAAACKSKWLLTAWVFFFVAVNGDTCRYTKNRKNDSNSGSKRSGRFSSSVYLSLFVLFLVTSRWNRQTWWVECWKVVPRPSQGAVRASWRCIPCKTRMIPTSPTPPVCLLDSWVLVSFTIFKLLTRLFTVPWLSSKNLNRTTCQRFYCQVLRVMNSLSHHVTLNHCSSHLHVCFPSLPPMLEYRFESRLGLEFLGFSMWFPSLLHQLMVSANKRTLK